MPESPTVRASLHAVLEKLAGVEPGQNSCASFAGSLSDLTLATLRLDEKVDAGFTQVTERIDTFEKRVDDRFEQIDRRFEQVDQRFEQIDRRFEQVDQRFVEIDRRLAQVDVRFGVVEDQLRNIDGRLEQLVGYIIRDERADKAAPGTA